MKSPLDTRYDFATGEPPKFPLASREKNHLDSDTVKILGAGHILGGDPKSEFHRDFSRWAVDSDPKKPPFREWRLTNNQEFHARWEAYMAEIGDLPISQGVHDALLEHQEQVRQEEIRRFEQMSEQELRQEIVGGINQTLGTLAVGPVADGTSAMGYGREWDWRKKLYGEGFQKEMMLPLFCSYIRFTKAFAKDEQVGVRLELLGLMDSGSSRKDGLSPSDNRYYFIPLNEMEPVIVSTESFISRAWSLNPQAAEGVLLPEVISEELEKQEAPIDSKSGLPRWRVATLQDLRDAVAIIRGYKNFVAEIIRRTPREVWGRSGLTE